MPELDFHTETFLLKMISANKCIIMCIVLSDYYTQDGQRKLLGSAGVATPSGSPPTHGCQLGLRLDPAGQYEDQTV